MAKINSYFKDFITMMDFSCRAAEQLKNSFESFKPESIEELRREMHNIEHEEDTVKHQMMERLVKEFVTPIDREDIIQLAHDIDEVLDELDDVLIRMYMHNIRSIRPTALEYIRILLR